MSQDCLKLTIYFGERDRAGGAFLADILTDIYARHQLQTSLVMRGVEGFGIKHHLHSDRLLSLSEDLPLVSVAVDTRPKIESVVDHVTKLGFDGLVTLERARTLTGQLDTPADDPESARDEVKLTVYLGRHERIDRKPGYEAVVEMLRRHGVAGATVLLGVDGTAYGRRQRAGFFSPNVRVPLMVIAIGDGQTINRLLPELFQVLPQPLLTLERVRICKRDGQRLAEPPTLPDADPHGLGVWQKLTVYASEQARSGGRPLHHQLIRELRGSGAAGATSLRGIWGYHGDHAPEGDSFWQLRRRVPVLTVTVDTPARIRRSFGLADELTQDTGLITSEIVPGFRATSPDLTHGGLTLSRLEP